MHKPYCQITPEGWPAIGFFAFASLIFALLGCGILSVVFLLLCAFALHFFRDPERVIPQDEAVGVSPADGVVIRIEARNNPVTAEHCLCISIFMNVFSVHVNRSPVEGRVEAIRYWPGKFVNAALDKASTDNERCAYVVRDAGGNAWTMVQIAGLIARRIVCRTEVGDTLARGERFGMIRFGSRVDLYLPEGYAPSVQIGEQVFAGQSIVARDSRKQA